MRRVRITVREGNETGDVLLQWDIDPAVTRTVVLYVDGGRDRVMGNRNLPLTVRIIDTSEKRDRPEEEVALR